MGLDVALGILVLIGAIRGWFRGFASQAIRLGALVGCVYLADPVRDLARPAARSYLPSVAPELLDRLLWWTSAALAFVVTAGLASWVLKAARKRPIGDPEPHRADQGAGFAFGGAKSALALSFLLAAIGRHGPDYGPKVGDWAVEQMKTSRALAFSERFKPADRVWASPPVQGFLAHVRTRGLGGAAAGPAEAKAAVAKNPEADRTRSLLLPRVDDVRQQADELMRLREELRKIEESARAQSDPGNSR